MHAPTNGNIPADLVKHALQGFLIEIVCRDGKPAGHHAAADIDAHRGRNDRADSGNHAADGAAQHRTAADGLAVGRASGFVGGLMRPFMSGCYTLQDERMYTLLAQLADAEDLYLEPSALAGMYGPVLTQPGQLLGAYTEAALPAGALANATHLVWATGGNMVPREEMQRYYAKGRALAQG